MSRGGCTNIFLVKEHGSVLVWGLGRKGRRVVRFGLGTAVSAFWKVVKSMLVASSMRREQTLRVVVGDNHRP